MKRLFSALLVAGAALCATTSAQARIFDGWLGDCVAVTATSCTEVTTAGYARQAVSMSGLSGGVVVNTNSITFPQVGTGNAVLAGRAVYDAPTGGNLVLVLPVATAYSVPTIGDRLDTGAVKFTIAGYTGTVSADVISAAWQAGTAIGTTTDGSSVTVGVNVAAARGVASAYLGASDALYSVGATQTTGFAVTIPTGVSTYGISGAGTLAAGSVALQATPSEGEVQRLYCDVTVTALTVTPGAGYAFIGTPPTTCGANASHEFQYFVAAKKVRVLF